MGDFVSSREAAAKWGVSLRYVQRLVAEGRVPGAKRYGNYWMIPRSAEKPADPRKEKNQPQKPPPCPLPYGIPNFLLSSFYSAPGTADALIGSLSSAEAKTLCAALLAYYRGQDVDAMRIAGRLFAGECCFETQVGCCLVLAICSMYSGSLAGWNRARARLMALRRNHPESAALIITEAALSGVLYMGEAPEWLQKGRFSDFPAVSYPVLNYLYAKWLLTQRNYDGLLAAIEPMISAMSAAGSLLSRLFLHLIAAVAYRISGDEKSAAIHIETALDLALPDGLYGALAEYRRQTGKPLDDALKRRDPAAFVAVRNTYDRLAAGFTALHNAVTGDVLTNELTLREYEIAALALQNESNAEIARRLGVTVGSVKKYFTAIYAKLGISGRRELHKYIV